MQCKTFCLTLQRLRHRIRPVRETPGRTAASGSIKPRVRNCRVAPPVRLRRQLWLSEWVERARGGDEIVITDRGVPVARLLGLTTAGTLQRLAAEGVIGRPASSRRQAATGRTRPSPRHPVSEVVSEQRR